MQWLGSRSGTLRYLIHGLNHILDRRGDKMEPTERKAIRREIEDYEDEKKRRDIEFGIMSRNPELCY
jgi:hypothetical protein